jgi:hypothetical protein
MLADPRECSYCGGVGRWHSVGITCPDCNGSGVVCNMCDKREGECECGGDVESFADIKRKDPP